MTFNFIFNNFIYEYFFGALIVMFAFLSFIQFIRLILAINWLKKNNIPPKIAETSAKLYLLIPVLNEQKVIKKSFQYFNDLVLNREWLRIVFICSAKENHSKNNCSTYSILKKLNSNPNIIIHKCPLKYGVMSHQLNYSILKLTEYDKTNFSFGIYNVDSEPGLNAIEFAFTELSNNNQKVLQQYAWYCSTINEGFKQKLLNHTTLWQNRWTLQFEIGRQLFENKFNFHNNMFLSYFHYTIGHGLFLSLKTWQEMGEFPEDEINEDAFLGLILALLKRKINAIPFLEKTYPPKNLHIYFKQQSVWFNGPFFSFNYLLKLLYRSSNKHISRPVVKTFNEFVFIFIKAVKLFLHAIYWVSGPIIIIIMIPLIFILYKSILLSLIWAFLTIYFTFYLNYLSNKKLKEIGISNETSGGLVYSLLAYLLHCFGPLLCIFKTILCNNNINTKYKTEK